MSSNYNSMPKICLKKCRQKAIKSGQKVEKLLNNISHSSSGLVSSINDFLQAMWCLVLKCFSLAKFLGKISAVISSVGVYLSSTSPYRFSTTCEPLLTRSKSVVLRKTHLKFEIQEEG